MKFTYSTSPNNATEWRPVHDYDGIYEVSDLGHVRRLTDYGCARRGMTMAVTVMKTGYLGVWLSKGGKCVGHRLHRIVAESFYGPCPSGMVVNHKDRDKSNPALSNLEYVTPSENTIHAYKNGMVAAHGTAKPIAKLNEKSAKEIFISRERGDTLARLYNVSQQTVCDIRNGRTWKHVTSSLETQA